MLNFTSHFSPSPSPSPDSVITTLRATDVDTSDSDQLTYYLVGESSVFSVQQDTGQIRNIVLLDRLELDTKTLRGLGKK